MSAIDDHRQLVRDRIAAGRHLPGAGHEECSPCGRFRLVQEVYSSRPEAEDEDLSIVTVSELASGAEIARLYRDDARLWHAWVERPDGSYLIGPPECLEGRTVVDLSRRRIASDPGETDPFIGTEFHVAPDGRRIAVVGCYWACPYECVVYDIREPMLLPWRPLARFDLPLGPDSYGSFGRWIAPDRFTLVAADGSSSLCSVADEPGGRSIQVRETTDLRRLWSAIRADLNQARGCLPATPLDAGGALARYEDWLSHNELQLALEELELVGDASTAPPEFWRCLARAAQRMGLTTHAHRLQTRSNRADPMAP